MLERKPDAMITCDQLHDFAAMLERANSMGIPVVDLDGNLDHKIAADAGVIIAFSIGSDNEAAGAQGAEYLVSKLGKGRRLFSWLRASLETSPVSERGFQSDWLNWLRLKGSCLTSGWLGPRQGCQHHKRHINCESDLVGIFAANDGMALGAVETVFAAGKQSQVTVIGVDGNSDNAKSIKSGRLNASVSIALPRG